ncbi:MAG: fabG [Gammaproteobacteria bacterium]|nr:fabG [Gammaproteobacteria bacterium]
MNKLEGRIALVTGAASGIGKAIAVAFAREGAHVIVADNVAESSAAKVLAEIRGHGGEALFVHTDVSDENSVRSLDRGDGRIINLASQLGRIGGTAVSRYAASKAAVIGLTKSLAREVAQRGVLAET